ncbi:MULTISPECIES: ABC transporter permease [Ureibacillus]|jgi:oligopeptide transport system permease protein|uniref:Oligopeptide transport system permease protein n=1 Tax=Ureibacillus thermosphaericus TaxID=51173 RepID=A0A840PSA5_URETH|nr:ABC transporter permease [Ureibacillus thermosphaericus]MBB5149359.1 oligopeptide transport system permease protein [Ureibacillus thermosphaericus]NKZ32220.1 ABC transporter permease [Ureibacillus thermosphaericus]
MLGYIVKRLLQSVVTLFVIITVVFFLLRLLPEEGYLGAAADKMTPEQQEVYLTNLGLRDPILVQLGNFYLDLLRGDLGKSITYRTDVPVIDIIADKIVYSFAFGVAAVALSIIVGVPLGIFMAQFKGRWLDRLGTGYIVFIVAVPSMVYYLLIQVYITDFLNLPMLFNEDKPITWVLPLISLSLGPIASYAMWMRRYMVDELNKDYIKLARAKGVKERTIMFRHVMRNAFIPLAQYLPATILLTITGSIYIESLYSIPGMGGLLVDAIQRQDNPVVQALVLLFSSLGIIGLFLGDVAMALVDPRIKFGKGESVR